MFWLWPAQLATAQSLLVISCAVSDDVVRFHSSIRASDWVAFVDKKSSRFGNRPRGLGRVDRRKALRYNRYPISVVPPCRHAVSGSRILVIGVIQLVIRVGVAERLGGIGLHPGQRLHPAVRGRVWRGFRYGIRFMEVPKSTQKKTASIAAIVPT